MGFPIRKSLDHRLLAPSQSLSWPTPSFIGTPRQGIHRLPLLGIVLPFLRTVGVSHQWDVPISSEPHARHDCRAGSRVSHLGSAASPSANRWERAVLWQSLLSSHVIFGWECATPEHQCSGVTSRGTYGAPSPLKRGKKRSRTSGPIRAAPYGQVRQCRSTWKWSTVGAG